MFTKSKKSTDDSVEQTISKINDLSQNTSIEDVTNALGLDKSSIKEIKDSDNSLLQKGENVPLSKESVLESLKDDLLLLNNKAIETFELSREQIEQLKPHSLMEAVPHISNEENLELLEDITVNGFIDVITITKKMEIVDGRARVELSLRPEVIHKPLFTYYTGKDENILDFTLSKNVFRRQLTQGQKAAAALNLLEIIKKENNKKLSLKMRQLKESLVNDVKPDEEKIDSRNQAAKYYNVSSSYVGKAYEVKKNSPEIFKEVIDGKLSLEEAYKKSKPEVETRQILLSDIYREFEAQHGKINDIVKYTIEFIKALGFAEISSAKTVLNKLKTEIDKKSKWEMQPDDTKFKRYLEDFLIYMRRNLKTDKKYNEFTERISPKQLEKKENCEKILQVRIKELKLLLNDEEIIQLELAIEGVNKKYTEFASEEMLESIIKKFTEQVSGISK